MPDRVGQFEARSWSVVPVDDRALKIRSYEDGDDLDSVIVVCDSRGVVSREQVQQIAQEVVEQEAKALMQRAADLEAALRSIVNIGAGPFDREMAPQDRWLPMLNTCLQIAEEALDA